MALTCPACGASMRELALKAQRVDRCIGCGGVWFDLEELAKAAHCALPPITSRAPSKRDCPRCETALDVTRMEPVNVERCGACKGTFLDGGEFRELRRGRPPRPTGRMPPHFPADGGGDAGGALAGADGLLLVLSLLAGD